MAVNLVEIAKIHKMEIGETRMTAADGSEDLAAIVRVKEDALAPHMADLERIVKNPITLKMCSPVEKRARKSPRVPSPLCTGKTQSS